MEYLITYLSLWKTSSNLPQPRPVMVGSIWKKLESCPENNATLTTLKGHVLAVGGERMHGVPTGVIHCYDVATNSWSAISEMPTPRLNVLAAVLPSNELVVVGGSSALGCFSTTTTTTEIAIFD